MRVFTLLMLVLLTGCIAAPVMAANDDRYSYITVEEINVRLDNATAVIDVNYTVDEGTRFIFFLLGKQDLKNKLVTILNYDHVETVNIDLSHAKFVVSDASFSYGKGIYWYPAHTFNVVIPRLSVQSPQLTQDFANTNRFPDGLGYFEPQPLPAQ
ncbi:MAG: hypothetical protein WC391_05015 [Methanoregula sp.]|jgi:hypothetical protein